MVTAAASTQPIAAPVLVFLLIGGAVIYSFGYIRAVMHRANSDYKKTKAGLPGMRKDYWRAWWRAVKVSFWVFVGFAVMVMWTVHDARQQPAPPTPVPASAKVSK